MGITVLIILLHVSIVVKDMQGKTINEFHHRWNNWKSSDTKNARFEVRMLEHLFKHSNNKDHSAS